jgi:hypothetical protein
MAQVVNSEEPLLTKLRHDDILRFWLRWEIKDGKFIVQLAPTAAMSADELIDRPTNVS